MDRVFYCIEEETFKYFFESKVKGETLIKISEEELGEYEGNLIVTEKYEGSLEKWRGVITII